MTVLPPETPCTTPTPEIVATDVLVLLHAPPGVASDKVIVLPVHTLVGPVIVPAVRYAPIVITFVATYEPHALTTLYIIVSRPEDTPVSKPVPLIVALPLVALHVPPGTVSVSVVNVPAHTVAGPTIVPAPEVELTVMLYVATAVPQLLVIE